MTATTWTTPAPRGRTRAGASSPGRSSSRRIETEREKDGDILVFDPTRVVDGIELSDDPVLRFRSDAYSASVLERSGVARGA